MKTRILAAEDHNDLRGLLRLQLQVLGYEVTIAKNGLEAVAIALAEYPDMVLMDVVMPKMDGFEAVSQIRENPGLRQIPILAVTGWVSMVWVGQLVERGFDGHIVKPFTHRELQSAIEKLLKIPGRHYRQANF